MFVFQPFSFKWHLILLPYTEDTFTFINTAQLSCWIIVTFKSFKKWHRHVQATVLEFFGVMQRFPKYSAYVLHAIIHPQDFCYVTFDKVPIFEIDSFEDDFERTVQHTVQRHVDEREIVFLGDFRKGRILESNSPT